MIDSLASFFLFFPLQFSRGSRLYVFSRLWRGGFCFFVACQALTSDETHNPEDGSFTEVVISVAVDAECGRSRRVGDGLKWGGCTMWKIPS